MGVGLKVQLESAVNGSETAAGMTLQMMDYSPLKLKRSKRDCVAFKVVLRSHTYSRPKIEEIKMDIAG